MIFSLPDKDLLSRTAASIRLGQRQMVCDSISGCWRSWRLRWLKDEIFCYCSQVLVSIGG